MSNEKEIRQLVKSMMIKQFPDSFTFDEFMGGGLITRPDLATFLPNAIFFTEIKSNKDTLDRLDNQVSDYSLYADSIYVILDEIHHKKWWSKYKNRISKGHTYFYKDNELYLANENLDTKIEKFRYYSYPHNKTGILSFLWKNERYCFTGFLKGRTKILNETLVIEHLYTAKEIVDISHYILYDRAKNRANSENGKQLTYQHGRYVNKIPYKEHRQELFNNIECERAILKTSPSKENRVVSLLDIIKNHKKEVSNV